MEHNTTIRVVALSDYTAPDISEYTNRDYVTFGKKNSFYDTLIDASRGSVSNGACISSITNLVYGNGLTATDKARKPNEWAQMLSLFKPNDIRRIINDLKTTGQCALQIQWAGGHKKIKQATHLAIEALAPEKVNEDGEIEAYYYAADWSKVRGKKDLTRIPVLGTSKEGLEILVIKPYQAGMFYFAYPDWYPAIQWAELEQEIANYHLNHIKNGFAPSMFISLNNGVPESEEEADEIVRGMMNKYKGSSGAGNVIISFSDGKEYESTMTPVPLSEASEQYQFLSDESGFKILSAHKIPSPLLIGMPSKTGFSSNADEMKTGSILMETYVLNPIRTLLIEGLDEILTYNDISLNLEFESFNPFKDDVDVNIDTSNDETLSMDTKLAEELAGGYLESLGETISDEWVLIDERDVEYDLEADLNEQVSTWNSELNEVELASTGTARPNSKSDQDGEVNGVYFKTRYKYTGNASPDREFCSKMMGANKVYRKEDIVKMSSQPVNKGFGEGGSDTYDIFLYKGGARCEHKWLRQTYMSSTASSDTKSPLAKTISSNQAENKYKYRVRNAKEVSMKPADMPRSEFAPSNANLPKDA